MDWPEELIKIPWKLILDNKGKKTTDVTHLRLDYLVIMQEL